MLDLQHMRREYMKSELDISTVDKNPFVQFERWFSQALNSEISEPNSMILATSGSDNIPNIRAVLLKIFDERGFVFFTNYNSQKAKEISENPNVALEFLWLDLERQVRIIGICEKISQSESISYFAKRSRGSQLGAWISEQSKIINSRQMLLMQIEKMKEKFKNGKIPLPDFWGGYRVIPQKIEFWQGREDRIHDRILYEKKDNTWELKRLAP
ncbi:MAG: pyridoxamine 5'-phosphate oxidase [Sulfurospirillaceae bacterium]|nr:pyridoxamine 5'-phosphate oxidase [Sulfurospirillaceae bacterium]